MGMFSGKRSAAEAAEGLRVVAQGSAAVSRAAKAVGADKVAGSARRSAAEQRVVARYWDSGRCNFGHRDCPGHD